MDSGSQGNNRNLIIALVVVAVVLFCCCPAIIGGLYALWTYGDALVGTTGRLLLGLAAL